MKARTISLLAAFAAMFPLVTSCNDTRKGDTLTVISYNIRNSKAQDGENAWDERKEATAEMLGKVNPDIFGVQEAYPNQISFITESCPRYISFGVGREDGLEKGEHMSIFYNSEALEMLDGGTYWLSETPDEPSKGWDAACRRTATWALMKDRDSQRKFYFVNTHLDHKGVEARRNGLALIVERIAAMNSEGYPMVLTGDFNVTPSDQALTDLNVMMKSARETASVTDDRPSFNGFDLYEPSIIDYIYYSGFADCTEFKVLTDQYAGKTFISDHYPVVSTLVY
ncbi:MAG: endonuclease/exonuclease/phosphatase family protein [Bacteroidales bacterium]|nr:endonuclease/exonuclease/phosphatase family protein [Bacteroidales bacterium]